MFKEKFRKHFYEVLAAVVVVLIAQYLISYYTGTSSTLAEIKAQYAQVHKETKNLVYSKEALENRLIDKAENQKPDLEKNKEIECWQKVISQYAVSPYFLNDSQSLLNEVIGSWYYDQEDKKRLPSIGPNTSHPEKFLYALARADLLEGLKIEKNQDESLLLLNEIIRDDPTNSAPVLYAAIIEEQKGHEAESKKYIQLLKSRTRFDSYLMVFTKALFSEVKTPSDLLAAQEVWSKAPIPDYMTLKNFINKNRLTEVAHQLTFDGLQKTIGMTDLTWVPIEYAMGKASLDKLEKNNNLLGYREIQLQKKSLLDAEMVHMQLETTCNLNSLEDYVKILQSFLK